MEGKGKIGVYVRWLGIYFFFLIVTGLGIGAVGSLLRMFAAVPIVIWLFTCHKFETNKMVVTTFIFILCCFATLFWSIDFNQTISRVSSHLMFFILLISTFGYSYSNEEISYLKKMLVNSSRLSALVLLATGTYGEGRLMLSGIITEDANYLCAYFMFAVTNAVDTVLASDMKISQKLLSAAEILIYIYVIFSTGSRGGMFAVAAVIIADIFIFREDNSSRGTLVRKIVISVLILVFAYFATSLLPQNVAERFTVQAIKESDGTGRYGLWESAANAFAQSNLGRKMFGYGAGSVRRVTYLFPFTRHNVLHNVFLENVLEIGLIGTVSYLAHISSFWITAIQKKSSFCMSILIGMLVLSFSTSIYTFKPYWNVMLFTACCWKNIALSDSQIQ